MSSDSSSERPLAPLAGRGRVGLALGSGAAKGWAHIGVIRALEARGVHADVVCGTSMGAVVGAAYAANRLDEFEAWAEDLEWTSVVGYLDLAMRGGLIKARRLFEFFVNELPDVRIEDLPRPFASVGTDLSTGQEVWMREGRLLDALRASIALPGLITPARWEDRWLVDGGLVNPVPVSLARALGADFVIAVDLNTTLLSRRFRPAEKHGERGGHEPEVDPEVASMVLAEGGGSDGAEIGATAVALTEPGEARDGEREAAESGMAFSDRLNLAFREIAGEWRERFRREGPPRSDMPSMYDVIANSINIMQVRIGRSRMAGDPPELLVTPRLGDYGLLEFDRSAEAIDEGARAVERAWAAGFARD
jgi:NTE family protein